MKLHTALAVAWLGGMPALSHAFTLDAVGYDGSELAPTPYAVFVPGYGELVFEAPDGSSLVVTSAYRNDDNFSGPALSFDPCDAVKITFDGLEPLPGDFDFPGAPVSENFDVRNDLSTLQGRGDGAGLDAVSWSIVPEPTSVALGLFGTAALFLRRRR